MGASVPAYESKNLEFPSLLSDAKCYGMQITKTVGTTCRRINERLTEAPMTKKKRRSDSDEARQKGIGKKRVDSFSEEKKSCPRSFSYDEKQPREWEKDNRPSAELEGARIICFDRNSATEEEISEGKNESP